MAEAKILPSKKPANGHLDAEIIVTNPRPKPFTASLSVGAGALGAGLDETKPLRITVPAGKSVRKKVSLSRPETDKGFAIEISAASPDVFTRDCIVRQRPVLNASAREGAPFAMKLAGFPAVEGNLALKGNTIFLRLAVDDTKIAPGMAPWEGSGIELFFASQRSGGIRRVFLVPQKGARKVKVAGDHLRPLPAVKARIGKHPRGAGYEMHVEIPSGAVGVNIEEGDFLFEMYVHLSALGDAHSGGRTMLSTSLDANSRSTAHESTAYALVN